MATPQEKLAQALAALQKLQQDNDVVIIWFLRSSSGGLNFNRLYYLIPSLPFHYSWIITTTNQSAPAYRIGILPLG